MSKEIILKIRQAEEEAARIRMDADEKVKEKIRSAQSEGALACEKAVEAAEHENALKVQLTRQKADELLERSRRDGQAEAQKLRESSEIYMRDAVRLIIGGIFEKCQ